MTPRSLKHFPWTTFGRPEESSAFLGKCREQTERSVHLGVRPRFTVLVPVSAATSPAKLERALDALSLQGYPDVDTVVCGEPNKLFKALSRFPSVKLVEASGSLAVRLNAGAAEATGDWLGVVDAHDVLSPATFFQIAVELERTRSELVFTNEAELSPNGSLAHTLSKSDPNAFNLIHFNCIGRFWTVRTDAFHRLGGFRDIESFEHDFFLRAETARLRFALVPSFLYYRDSPPPLQSDLVCVVRRHLEDTGQSAYVVAEAGALGAVRVSPAVDRPKEKLVSVIVCFRDRAQDTIRALKALEMRLGRVRTEVILVDNGSQPSEWSKIEQAVSSTRLSWKRVFIDTPFNFAHLHNRAVREHSSGDLLLLLNNDVFWEADGSLDTLVAWAARREIGTVGITLRYPDGALQHGGMRALFGGENRLARIGNQKVEDPFTTVSRSVFANSFAFCLFRRELFDELGGLRESDLPNGFGDLAFNLECLRRGLTNVNLGYIQAVHAEGASRGWSYEAWEENVIEREYADLLQKMLRRDLGYDRAVSGPLSHTLAEAISQRVLQHFPRIADFKSLLRNSLRFGTRLVRQGH